MMNRRLFVIDRGVAAEYPLHDSETFGRPSKRGSADIILPKDFVSRSHGRFTLTDRGMVYEDLGSTNGTWIGTRKAEAGRRYLLSGLTVLAVFDGDPEDGTRHVAMLYSDGAEPLREQVLISRLCRGDVVRTLRECGSPRVLPETAAPALKPEAPAPARRMEEEGGGDALRVDIRERLAGSRGHYKKLLEDIHFTIRPGELVLILGGSGAGKTTLMNAIMGYEEADGVIKYGDLDVYDDYETVRSQIGYVPQQDLLRGKDTAYATLQNAAQMKLVNSMTPEEMKERIDRTLHTLGLEREKDTLVGKLSGGQRKRLSIAVEYVSDPGLFFLDEPDSGLDGIMARTLLENLRSIADEGKMVMVISHGPDRGEDLFDKVIVLAKSEEDNCGHLAFFGSVQEALRFFDTASLEAIVRRINRKDEGGEGLADQYIRLFRQQGRR